MRALSNLPTAAFAALLAGAVPAQQRLATAGRVLDGAGKPLAGATVMFAGALLPRVDTFAVDRVVATTDDKGRFRAELLDQADYVAWATGAGHASALQLDVRAGTGVEFVAATPLENSLLRVDGLDAWPDLAPLRVEVAPALPLVQPMPLALDSGVGPMPAMAAGVALRVFVRDRDGSLLFAFRESASPGETHVVLPAPRDVAVRVRDAAGAPIAGASLRLQVAHRLGTNSPWAFSDEFTGTWRDVGTTGADGAAVVRLPAKHDPFEGGTLDGLMLATKADHAATISGWNGFLVVDNKIADKPLVAARELPFTLHAQPPWRGRVRGADGRPLAGVVLRLEGRVAFLREKGCSVAFVARSRGDGTFTFDGLPAVLEQPRLVASLPDGNTDDGSHNGQALVWCAPDPTEPLELDLRRIPLLTLRARDTGDGPARHARVSLLPVARIIPGHSDKPLQVVLDARGEARLRLQPGRWCVSVFDRTGAAPTSVDLERDQTLELKLQQLAVVRGSMHLTDLTPVGEATFTEVFGSGSGAVDEAAYAAGLCAMHVNRWLATRTRPGTDGSFVLPFLAAPGFDFTAQVHAPGVVARLNLTATDEPVEITLRR